MNRGQTFATPESITAYVRQTIGDSNRGQTRATPENITAYARHTIGSALIFNGLRNNEFTRIRATALPYNSNLLCLYIKIVVYPINLNFFCQHG